MSPEPRSSWSVRFTCTALTPSASASSSCVSGERATVVFGHVHGREADCQLTQKMRQALLRGAPSQTDRPFRRDGILDGCQPPEDVPYGGLPIQDGPQAGMRHDSNRAGRKSRNAVVNPSQQKTVQIADVARKEESRELAAAVGEHPVAAGPPIQHDMQVIRAVSFGDDIGMRRIGPHCRARLMEEVQFTLGEACEQTKACDERIVHRRACDGCRAEAAGCKRAGAQSSLRSNRFGRARATDGLTIPR